MKKAIITLLILAGVVSYTMAQKTSFSNKALTEKLLALDGTEITFQDILAKHQGKTVVIEVWASWCSDCVKAMPLMKNLQSENTAVDYVFVSLDKTPENWKLGIEKHELKGDHYFAKDGMKGKFGKAIDLDWIPRYIVVDKSGKIALYKAIETDFDKIKETINNK